MNFVSNLKPNDRTKYHSMSEKQITINERDNKRRHKLIASK